MINEELAVLAQAGDKGAMWELWEQVKAFCMGWSYKDFAALEPQYAAAHGVALEDFQQESYIGFTEAVKSFDSSKGYKFITYLHYPIQTAFNSLLGRRTERQKKEPLNNCGSLDEPISGTDDICYSDTVVDEQAAQDFDNATDLVCIDQLHAAIDKAMDLTCGDRQREVIEQRYYEERSLKQCGDSMGISYSRVRQIECEALRRMRQPRARRLLQPFADELLGTAAYSYSTSLSSWKNKGSNPERVVEYLEQVNEIQV